VLQVQLQQLELVQQQELVQEQLRCERHRCQQWCCCSRSIQLLRRSLERNRSSCERRGEPSSEPKDPSSSLELLRHMDHKLVRMLELVRKQVLAHKQELVRSNRSS
jgi:hypothetical protein